MKLLWQLLGKVVYWASYIPATIYLRNRPRSRVFLVCQDTVLLTKDLIGYGRWMLPGGGRHANEASPDAACRELLEETGVKLTASNLTLLCSGRYTRHGNSPYDVFLYQILEKPLIKSNRWEILTAAWVPLEQISTDEMMGEDVRLAYEHFMKTRGAGSSL